MVKKVVFPRFGTPRALISNGGSHFCNHVVEALLKKYGVTHKVATIGFRDTKRNGKIKNLSRTEPRIHVIRLIDCLGFPKPYQERK